VPDGFRPVVEQAFHQVGAAIEGGGVEHGAGGRVVVQHGVGVGAPDERGSRAREVVGGDGARELVVSVLRRGRRGLLLLLLRSGGRGGEPTGR
jgi:hypothetical protein